MTSKVMKSFNAEANRLEAEEANASKFHDVKTLVSFSYDSDNVTMKSFKRRVVNEGRLQLSSFIPRYNRVNKMLPQARRSDELKVASSTGHSKLFATLIFKNRTGMFEESAPSVKNRIAA